MAKPEKATIAIREKRLFFSKSYDEEFGKNYDSKKVRYNAAANMQAA
ncbi:hypothetical protein [Marinibactrum halimedae]|uniref:Uncharacterized protein n=1 Tax=Marinibactrum halimedae TaxID=1444977 RepID=A0AA37WM55_9GAMM|nr:hypothetical protein [Marinibactrum halimedae]MCD9458724.1 hypothetical protein [Marinibactrum halimedae]GLS25910.1 hypothetical protein GCM10007877_16250 [Marinibactrum halimedae]